MSQFKRSTKKVTKLKKKGRDFIYLGLGAIVMVLPMLFIAAKQSSLVNMGYSISNLQSQIKTLRDEQVKLETELTALSRPDRIWQRAHDLGMVPISEENRYQVEVRGLTKTENQMVATREP